MKERAWGVVGTAGFASGIVKALNTNHWWLVLIALFLLAVLLILAVCWAVQHMDADEVQITKSSITVKRRTIRKRRPTAPERRS